mgnify:CR=1 FL=1
MILETYKDLLRELTNLSDSQLDMNISIRIDDEYVSGASGFIRSIASDGNVLDHGHPLIEVAIK